MTGDSHSISVNLTDPSKLQAQYYLNVSVEYNRDDICVNDDSGVMNAAGDKCSDYIFPYCTTTFDDIDFTARDMCCLCGGGNSTVVKT